MDKEKAFQNAQQQLEVYRKKLLRPDVDWPEDVCRGLNHWNGKLFDPGCTVEELKNENKTPGNNFSSRFKRYVHMTLRDYRTHHRLEAAKWLLTDEALTDLEIGEIGWLVGYEKLQSFSMAFKNKTGLPPGKWRAQQFNGRKK